MDTGQDYITSTGTTHAILLGADGKYYLADPDYALPGPHKMFLEPTLAPASGLGDALQQGIGVAATAANFIPVVGPFVSAALSIGGALFGGGDPTPLSDLISQIVDGRDQVAQLRNEIAGSTVDAFTIPSGFNPQDKQGTASLVEGIVGQVLNVTAADIQKNRRADYYAAIKQLNSAIASLQQQANTKQVAAQVETQVLSTLQPGAASTPPPATSADYNTVVSGAVGTTPPATIDPTTGQVVPAPAAAPSFLSTIPAADVPWIVGGAALIVGAMVLR